MNQRISCAASLAVIVLAGAPAFAVENKDVRVVNTPAERIPVDATGTVGLAQGTQVGVAGPVSLAAGSQVGVANTADSPLHVMSTAPAPETFVRQVNLEWTAGLGFGDIEVPAGRRLVIEYIGGRVFSSGETTVDFRITPNSIGGSAEFQYTAPARLIGLSYKHTFTEAVRLYHDGSLGPLSVGAIVSDGEVPAVGYVSVSGYLINTP